MKRYPWRVTMLAVGSLCLAACQCVAADLSFKDAKVGALPAGWKADKTGTGNGSVWKVVADESSPDGGKTLAQVSDKGSGGFFSLCVADAASYKDMDLTLSLKAIAGDEDQGGGPVWRYKDASNYYVCRVNPLEGNFRVYKVVDSKRKQLGNAEVDADADQWHTIRVVHKGNSVQCYLNGKLHLEVTDDTFKDAGKIGLWTKADAQTRFAGVKVEGK